MKKMPCVVALCLIISGVAAQQSNNNQPSEQSDTAPKSEHNTTFGLKAGLNVSLFSGPTENEVAAKVGPSFGGFIKIKIKESIFIRTEVYYSNQGQKDNYVTGVFGPSIGHTTTNLHYLNAPFLFEVGNRLTLLQDHRWEFSWREGKKDVLPVSTSMTI